MLHAFLEDLVNQSWEEWFDSSRLIFADWLDERNDPRGQVLRDPATYRLRCPLGVRPGARVLTVRARRSVPTVLKFGRADQRLARWVLPPDAHLAWRPKLGPSLALAGQEWWEVDNTEGETSIRMLLLDATQDINQAVSEETWSLTRERFQTLWRMSLLLRFVDLSPSG